MSSETFNEPAAVPRAFAPHGTLFQTAWRWWLLALVFIVADLLTKAATVATMPFLDYVEITSFFNYGHWRNPGAAFSFLADAGGWQRYFFVTLAGAVSIWLANTLTRPLRILERWAFSLILGGALGNGIDRAVRGYVVDFLDFHWRGVHWPAFNVADMAITTGVALMLVGAFSKPEEKP